MTKKADPNGVETPPVASHLPADKPHRLRDATEPRRAVVFGDGPFQGVSTLPEGAVEAAGNELHIPHATGLCIYMKADPVATAAVPDPDVPNAGPDAPEAREPVATYRLLRLEPNYRPPATRPDRPEVTPPIVVPPEPEPPEVTPHRDDKDDKGKATRDK
jgi:hypothetical protein